MSAIDKSTVEVNGNGLGFFKYNFIFVLLGIILSTSPQTLFLSLGLGLPCFVNNMTKFSCNCILHSEHDTIVDPDPKPPCLSASSLPTIFKCPGAIRNGSFSRSSFSRNWRLPTGFIYSCYLVLLVARLSKYIRLVQPYNFCRKHSSTVNKMAFVSARNMLDMCYLNVS